MNTYPFKKGDLIIGTSKKTGAKVTGILLHPESTQVRITEGTRQGELDWLNEPKLVTTKENLLKIVDI